MASYHSFKEVVEVIQESNKHLEKMGDSMEVLKTSVAGALTSAAGVLATPASSIPAPATTGGAGITGGGGGSSASMPSFDLGNTLGSLTKGASLNFILKVFPKLLTNAKSGFKKLGNAVKVLDDDSFENGANNLKSLTEALTGFSELNYAKLYASTKFFPFFAKSIQKMSKGLDVNAIQKDLEPLGKVSELLAGGREAPPPPPAPTGGAAGRVPAAASGAAKATNGVLSKIVNVLTDFAEVNWKGIIGSTVSLVLFAKGLSKAGKMMTDPAILNGIQALNPVIDSMKGMAENLKKMGESFGKALGSFFDSIGKQLGKIAKGALAISLMAGALFLSAKAFGAFSDVAWTDVLTGIVALGALTVAAIALGTVMSSGIGAVAIFLGAAAIAALGVALIPTAYAMQMAGEGMKLMGEGLTQIVPQLLELAAVTPMLFATATAIGAVSAALALFGAGQAVAGITSLFGKLTGSSPVEQLKELAGLGDGLQKTADALDRIRGANSTVASDQLSGAVTAADVTESTAKIETAVVAQSNADKRGIVNAPTNNMTSNNTTFVSSSWVPDRTSLFVLARA